MLHLYFICNIFQNHVCRVEKYRKLLELEYHCNSHGKCIVSPCFMILWFYDYKRYQYNFLRVQKFLTSKTQTSKCMRRWAKEASAKFTGKWKTLIYFAAVHLCYSWKPLINNGRHKFMMKAFYCFFSWSKHKSTTIKGTVSWKITGVKSGINR